MSQTPWTSLILCATISGAVASFATQRLMQPDANATESDNASLVPDQAVGAFATQEQWETVQQSLEEMRREMQSLSAAPRIPANLEELLRNAEERALAESAAALAADAENAEGKAGGDALDANAGDPQAWFDQITGGELSWEEIGELWETAKELGKTEELLALFQGRAESDPLNPDRHAELGDAYIQHLQQLGSSNSKTASAAGLADASYDRALELDPNHLGARRSKAISLSFWPAITGKRAEAVRQFEILIEKQEALPSAPSHRQSYVLLGNMYLQQGNPDRAREVWSNGLGRFPGNDELRSLLDGLGQ